MNRTCRHSGKLGEHGFGECLILSNIRINETLGALSFLSES